ncbi:hydrogen peroxide-dependent heme synthase [Acidipropionibacterium acidipropionici]|jgi:ferrochelatase|uniref:hydrogen peroxide-dependent heme synthase n=1 Tax=Acidipropionibacterium acidipropionici TaxID=1748 RepID=UPI00110AFF13|nr:hydrogen peroxide-dependent heme synthase [Acidipropionibacterium acidipropionici]QCV94204.1 ferrochelatase [Acidipropionibacterium acidipropionici]
MSDHTPARGLNEPLDPYDAVLIASFGGPRGPEEVRPFLRRVSGGRIPESRLDAVAEHYDRFGGTSPINDANDALLEALRINLRAHGSDVPVVLGNRNGSPYLADVVDSLYKDGARRVLMLPTSAFDSFSGCRQYRRDADAVLAELGHTDMVIDKVAPFWAVGGYTTANAEALMDAFGRIPPTSLEATRVVFVTHSIPLPMQEASGSGEPGTDYVAQHQQLCARVAETVRTRFGGMPRWDLVYCSRSGRPTDPWLEPDVNDYLRTLPAQGVKSVVLAPVGFISDHMEVVNDLDREAAETVADLGLAMARATTAGTHPAFVESLGELLAGQAAAVRQAGGRLPEAWLCGCERGGQVRGGRSLGDQGALPPVYRAGDADPAPASHPSSAQSADSAHSPVEATPPPASQAASPVADSVVGAGAAPQSGSTVAQDAGAAGSAPSPTSGESPVSADSPSTSSAVSDAAGSTITRTSTGDGTYSVPTDARDHAVQPDEVNRASLWAMYSVFKVSDPLPSDDAALADLVTGSIDWAAGAGAETRGWYDLSGLRADADLLVWWTAADAAALQETYHRFVGSGLGRHLSPVWSNLAVHRPAEFNKSHLPSCFAGVAPRRWACFYPFVRTKDWYLLDAGDRSRMLREHGISGAASPDVKASTLAAFALGDYEWILTLEADDPARLVDVMKDLRYVEARRHVDVDTPFFTGERVDPDTWARRQLRG